jgi:hypothetical protein
MASALFPGAMSKIKSTEGEIERLCPFVSPPAFLFRALFSAKIFQKAKTIRTTVISTQWRAHPHRADCLSHDLRVSVLKPGFRSTHESRGWRFCRRHIWLPEGSSQLSTSPRGTHLQPRTLALAQNISKRLHNC